MNSRRQFLGLVGSAAVAMVLPIEMKPKKQPYIDTVVAYSAPGKAISFVAFPDEEFSIPVYRFPPDDKFNYEHAICHAPHKNAKPMGYFSRFDVRNLSESDTKSLGLA